VGRLTPLADGSDRRARRAHRRTGYYVPLVILAVFALAPLVFFVFNALKTRAELARDPFGAPSAPKWSNFVQAWQQAAMAQGLRNSAIIVLGTVIGVTVVATMAAYALARLSIPGASWLMAYLIAGSALPIQLFLVPLFYLWTRLGLYDTHLGLIVIYTATLSPFATLLIRSFMVHIPRSLEEAARLDGCGELRVLLQVIVPVIRPALLSVALVTGMSAYNEFLLAVTFLQSSDKRPVATTFFSFQQGFTQDYVLVSAAGLIMLLPMLVLFLVLRRRFTEGIAGTGIGGG
jgi:raffinose/stachyose/melibiose transport system permease protein